MEQAAGAITSQISMEGKNAEKEAGNKIKSKKKEKRKDFYRSTGNFQHITLHIILFVVC